tara:strand:- start:3995 stop:4402 length:408 start_codon:yes stop_codon:yes gene_type:complete
VEEKTPSVRWRGHLPRQDGGGDQKKRRQKTLTPALSLGEREEEKTRLAEDGQAVAPGTRRPAPTRSRRRKTLTPALSLGEREEERAQPNRGRVDPPRRHLYATRAATVVSKAYEVERKTRLRRRRRDRGTRRLKE